MMTSFNEVKIEIEKMANSYFEPSLVSEFIAIADSYTNGDEIIGYLIQISTDQGIELEFGFYTKNKIVDITLSKGKIYSYSYPISKIQTVVLVDAGHKWTCTIIGEKKFDYNVVKPNSIESLQIYERSIREFLSQRNAEIVPSLGTGW